MSRPWAVVVEAGVVWGGRRERSVDVGSGGEAVGEEALRCVGEDGAWRVCACGCAAAAGDRIGLAGVCGARSPSAARMSSSSDESEGNVPSSCWPSSYSRSLSRLIRLRCSRSVSCAACLRDCVLTADVLCSRRRRRVRAYSRFLAC